jgi:predicted SAM-dependent methyltransferase
MGKPAPRTTPKRLGPGDPGGIHRIHVGCGPKNLMADWWNVDIRPFRGVDEVADVTKPWPWRDLDYVYGEHFLEHLALDDAVRFLAEAIVHLRPGGKVRLSTPGLEWVWATHFTADAAPDAVVADTYMANRAFHGWGHQFLYSRPVLERILGATGYTGVAFYAFGESDDPELRGLERHGTPVFAGEWPSVWNVEAARPDTGEPAVDPAILEEIEEEFVKYVRSGH